MVESSMLNFAISSLVTHPLGSSPLEDGSSTILTAKIWTLCLDYELSVFFSSQVPTNFPSTTKSLNLPISLPIHPANHA